MQNKKSTANPSRRGILRLGFTAAASVALPAVAAAAPAPSPPPQIPRLLKPVLSFIGQEAHYDLHLMETLPSYGPAITVPNHGGDFVATINDLTRLRKIGYGCASLRSSTFSGVSVADIASPEWDALEQEYLPLIKKSKTVEYNQKGCSESRHRFAKILQECAFAPTSLLSDVADVIEPRCLAAAHRMVSQSYAHDPVGFVRTFHKDGANVGLILHNCIVGKKEYGDFLRWVPPAIVDHIESMFPFSVWGKGPPPTGLNNRLFSLGADDTAAQLFHIALPMSETRKALSLLLGRSAARLLPLQKAEGGGVIMRLSSDQYDALGEQLANILPTRPQRSTLPTLDNSIPNKADSVHLG